HPRGRFKADNGTALVAAAIAGLGVAYLPNGLINEHLASGALVAVMTNHLPPPAGIYIVRPPGQHCSPKIRALTELFIEVFRTNVSIVDRHRISLSGLSAAKTYL